MYLCKYKHEFNFVLILMNNSVMNNLSKILTKLINSDSRIIGNDTELSRLTGVPQPTIRRLRTGESPNPRAETIKPLADFFGISISQLRGEATIEIEGTLQKLQSEGEKNYVLTAFDTWDSNTPLRDDEVEIPFFREVELAAGNGSTMIQENNGFKLRFSKSTLSKSNVDAGMAACVTVSGNSMEPVLPDGSTIGVDTSKTSIKDGDMYAIDHDGQLRVKTVYRMPTGIRLKSFNNDEWPDENYNAEDSQKIKILGRVFWWSVLR